MADRIDLGAASLSEALLRDLRAVDVRIGRVRLGKGAAITLPEQRRVVMHVVLEGRATVEAKPEAPVALHAGDAALIYYGDAHRIGAPAAKPFALDLGGGATPDEPPSFDIGAGEIEAVTLSCSMQLGYRPPALYASRTVLWTMRADAGDGERAALPPSFAAGLADLHGPGAMAITAVAAELYLFHALRQMYRTLWQDRAMAVGSPDTRRITHALQAINSQIDRRWTVASLARLVGMSRSAFAALFTAQVGVAPLAYLTSVRMTRAARLLELGMRPMTEVARRVGYPLPASFSRAFASFHGVSPSRFVKDGASAGG